MSESDDELQLSVSTLAALQQFYVEENERKEKMDKIMSGTVDEIPCFQEDWQLSQFWYNEETSMKLAEEAMSAAGENGKIALVSCPTLYKAIRAKSKTQQVKVFEFDERFAVFGEDFCFYDYRSPLQVPPDMSGSFDIVVADPPFLSEECLTKTSITVRFLTKNKIILCTGDVMSDLAKRLLQVEPSLFIPQHNNNLGNEFKCFVNYKTETLP